MLTVCRRWLRVPAVHWSLTGSGAAAGYSHCPATFCWLTYVPITSYVVWWTDYWHNCFICRACSSAWAKLTDVSCQSALGTAHVSHSFILVTHTHARTHARTHTYLIRLCHDLNDFASLVLYSTPVVVISWEFLHISSFFFFFSFFSFFSFFFFFFFCFKKCSIFFRF